MNLEDGFVYSWGINDYGQLGHGDTKDRYIPTLIDGLNKIKKIYCGGDYTMAINGNKINFQKYWNLKLENDELYVWGRNYSGQLGLGNFTKRKKPTKNSFFENKKITKLICGRCHCLALIGKIIFIFDSCF